MHDEARDNKIYNCTDKKQTKITMNNEYKFTHS